MSVSKAVKKILLVEDDDEVRETLRTQIKDHLNVQLIESSQGADANWKLKNDKFDILVIDLQLPKLSGIHIIKSLLLSPKETRPNNIVVVTGTIDEETALVYKQKKLKVFHKPVDFNLFVGHLVELGIPKK